MTISKDKYSEAKLKKNILKLTAKTGIHHKYLLRNDMVEHRSPSNRAFQ